MIPASLTNTITSLKVTLLHFYRLLAGDRALQAALALILACRVVATFLRSDSLSSVLFAVGSGLLSAVSYTLLICWATRRPASEAPRSRHLRADLAFVAVWMTVLYLQGLFARRLPFTLRIPWLPGIVLGLRAGIAAPLQARVPTSLPAYDWFAQHVPIAIAVTIPFWVLVPLAFLLLTGNRRRHLGFTTAWWQVGLLLSAWRIVASGRFGLFTQPEVVAVRFVGHILTAALPEEFWFRAVVQTRVEEALGNPRWAIIIAGFLFGLAHFGAHYRSGGDDILYGLTASIGYNALSGLLRGYLYYRTRSLAPAVIWHAFDNASQV